MDVRPIDANALLAEYQRLRMIYHADPFALTETEVASLDAISLIDKAPTLDYAPVRHGEWIRQDETFTRFQCSSCKSENHGRRWPFCPLCGAKMDGGKKDDVSEKG